MLANAEVRIRSERVLVALIPALKALFETREEAPMPETPGRRLEPAAGRAAASEALHDRFPALEKLAFSRRRKRVPFVQQNTASDCGAASLTMVLAYHGKHLRLDDVRKVTGFGRDGADALAILSPPGSSACAAAASRSRRSTTSSSCRRARSCTGSSTTSWSSSG